MRCLYPNGKKKAFNITYDDGVLQDRPFVELLNRYGLKGTFNLNSGLMKQQFAWVHPNGMTVRRMSEVGLRELYCGHEIASHTLTHPYMTELSFEDMYREMRGDKENLEAIFGCPVEGFAVPFNTYNTAIRQCVEAAGFAYGRNSRESRSFAPQTDRYNWSCTLFHLNPDLDRFVDAFLETDEEMACFQIVGHSYDLDAERMWDKMEAILKRIAEDSDVQPMTHLELVQYYDAMDRAEVVDGTIVNPSGIPLWFEVDGRIICVP